MKEPAISITLDLQKSSADTVVALKQGNTVGRIAIGISEDGFPYEIAEDCYAVLAATKPDGTILYNRCQIAGNTVFYEITEQTTAAPGRIRAEVKLYGKEDQLVTTASFCMVVHETVCAEETLESFDEVSALTHLVSKSLEFEQRGEELLALVDTASARIEDAVRNANEAADRADHYPQAAEEAMQKAEEVDAKVDTLREVVNRFHSNIQETAKGEVITMTDASDLPLAGMKVFGKTEQNGTPTPETPVPFESVGDVAVTVAGKNLLDLRKGATGTGGGVVYQRNSDGSYTRTGTATDSAGNFWLAGGFLSNATEDNTLLVLQPGETYYIRDCFVFMANKVSWSGLRTVNASEYPEGFKVTGVRNPNQSVGTTYNDTIYPMIVKGTELPEWESYKEIQTLPISTDWGLPGIPVTVGGNYTDSTGQQWVCDEVDFEKGLYVQRVKVIPVNITKAISSIAGTTYTNICYGEMAKPQDANFYGVAIAKAQMLCECARNNYTGPNGWDFAERAGYVFTNATTTMIWFGFPYGTTLAEMKEKCNSTRMVYALAEENHIPLSAEQLAAFAELHSNYHTTTVFNDKNAGMEVKYMADTKLYIDKKFNELATALVNRA